MTAKNIVNTITARLWNASSSAAAHILSLNLEREKIFFGVFRTARTKEQIRSFYLFSFTEKHSNRFLLTKFKAEKTKPL